MITKPWSGWTIKLRSGQLIWPPARRLIGVELAADLGLSPGGLRLQSASGEQISVRVAATLDFGLKGPQPPLGADAAATQNLLGTGWTSPKSMCSTDQLFEAETLAGNYPPAPG